MPGTRHAPDSRSSAGDVRLVDQSILMNRTSPDASIAATLRTALTPAVWGTTYIVATELLPPDRPMLAATTRALPVGLAFLAIGRRLPTGSWWWRSVVLGVLNIGAFFALLFVAAFRLPGGVAATAGAIQPVVAAGLAAIVIGEAFTRRTMTAGLTGIAGVAMLVLGPEAALDPIGVTAAVAGTFAMAAGVVLTKHWGRPVDLITFTGWQLTAGGLFLVPILLVAEGLPATMTGTNLAGFLWLALIGTGAAYANWFGGIQQLPIAIVSFLGLLSPLVATLAGWIALNETLTPMQLTGAILVVAAVITPHLGQHRTTDRRRSAEAVPIERRTPPTRPGDPAQRIMTVSATPLGHPRSTVRRRHSP